MISISKWCIIADFSENTPLVNDFTGSAIIVIWILCHWFKLWAEKSASLWQTLDSFIVCFNPPEAKLSAKIATEKQ